MLQFGLSNAPFWQNPSTNRIIRLQPIQPFIGNYQWVTSDVTGNAYYSNSSAATYNAVITAPPSPSINFSFTVTATNLGLVNVSNIVSIPGNAIQTIPSGMAAWPIYVSDARYAFNSNAPGGNAPLSANQSTNLVASAIPTNYWNSAATLWLSNLLFLGNVDTNLNLPGIEMTTTTNAGPPGSVTFNVNTNSPNGVATVGLLNFASNALASGTGGGISAATGTNIAVFVVAQSNAGYTTITGSNPVVFVNTNDYEKWTNGATSIRYSNAYSFLYTNNLPALTNTFLNTNTAANTYVPIQSGIANNLTASNPLTVIPQGSGNGQVVIISTTVGQTNTIVSLTTGGLGFQISPGGAGALGANDATVQSNQIITGVVTANDHFVGNGFGITNAQATNLGPAAIALATNGVANTITNLVMAGFSNGIVAASTSSIPAIFVTGPSNNTFTAGTNAAGVNSQAQVNTGSNSLWTLGTNFGGTNFVLNLGGGATNTFITNSPLYSGTNIGIGTYPVIYQSTNLVAFISSGTTSLTNALYVWNAGNYYTNTVNSGWITNNGSVWQVFNSAGLQLFSNAKLTGSWTLQGGVGAAVSDYGAYLRGDGVLIIGIVNSTNVSTNIIVNGGGGNATNAIALLNGFGTNTTFLFTSAAWGTNNSTSGSLEGTIVLGGTNNTATVQGAGAILGGINNLLFGSGGIGNQQGNAILGGTNDQVLNTATGVLMGGGTDKLTAGHFGVVAGGLFNTLGDGTGTYFSTILGGTNNNVAGSGTRQSIILNGAADTIGSGVANVLLSGMNVAATNNNLFMWSDGTVFNPKTNNFVGFMATNGLGINTNYANGNALSILGNLNVNGGSQITTESNTVGISGTTIGTNIAVGVNTNLFQSTNVVNIYQAGTALCTNGAYEWFSQNFYSNRNNTAILTNNGAQWLLVTNGVTLYNSATLINGSWTAVNGAGTASSVYGFYHLLNGEVMIGTGTATNFVQTPTNSPTAGQFLAFAGAGKNQWASGIGPFFAATNILVVSTAGSANGQRGNSSAPFSLLSQAVSNAQAGDFIIQLPGIYKEVTNTFINNWPQSVTWYSYPGATNIFAPTNGDAGNHALIKPATNDWFINPCILVSNAFSDFNTPIGAGPSENPFTGVRIDNAYITNDSDGFAIFTSVGACSWTLNNPIATTDFDTYNQTGAAHTTYIINPTFTSTNVTSTTNSTTGRIRRGVVVNFGSVYTIGGLITIGDPAGDTNYSAAFVQTATAGTNFISGTVIDTRLQTNVLSSDIVTVGINGTQFISPPSRIDGKGIVMVGAMNGANTRLVGSHILVGAGSASDPTLATVVAGTPNGVRSGTGIYFAGQNTVDFSIASNSVLNVSAALAFFTNNIYASSNVAPHTTITPSGLDTIAQNAGWTNDLKTRADLIVEMFTPAGCTNYLAFTNTTTGECWTNTLSAITGGLAQHQAVTFSDISPNDQGTLSNYTSGGNSTLVKAVWKLK